MKIIGFMIFGGYGRLFIIVNCCSWILGVFPGFGLESSLFSLSTVVCGMRWWCWHRENARIWRGGVPVEDTPTLHSVRKLGENLRILEELRDCKNE